MRKRLIDCETIEEVKDLVTEDLKRLGITLNGIHLMVGHALDFAHTLGKKQALTKELEKLRRQVDAK